MKQLYSKKVLEHFRNPYNMGEIKNPDGVATIGNPVCGDVMKMYIKVGKRKKDDKTIKYIKDIRFQTLGCAAAIATSSVITQMAKGMSLDKAGSITNKQVAQALGGLPKVKMHCSVLAVEAIKRAIKNYRKNKDLNYVRS